MAIADLTTATEADIITEANALDAQIQAIRARKLELSNERRRRATNERIEHLTAPLGALGPVERAALAARLAELSSLDDAERERLAADLAVATAGPLDQVVGAVGAGEAGPAGTAAHR